MTDQNYHRPSWDEYFIKIAEMVGSRGTCDRGRAGCVITVDKRIVSTGYVGAPINVRHCDEAGHEMHTVRHEDGHETRHCIRTTHAEQNAIAQAARSGISIKGGSLYCKMTPCYTCAKMIINAGITRIVCAQDYHASDRSKEIFAEAGVEFVLLSGEMTTYADMGNNMPHIIPEVAPVPPTIPAPSSVPPEIKSDNVNYGLNQNIYIYDEFNPEDTAMMQALYSRSPQSVVEHVEKVKKTGSGKFMETYYVGYGHSSIADCGSTTVFVEKISILADKALQDWPLYSGQETSTRYVDMSKQPIVDPLQTAESKKILDLWMNFYINNQTRVQEHLKKQYPRKDDEKETVYEKAIQARAFDIMRGFLPAGITTQLSWHTNLRQAWDKLSLMKHHPLEEVQEIAENILKGLKDKYQNSFSHEPTPEQEAYRREWNFMYNYYEPETPPNDFRFSTDIKVHELNQYKDILARPPKTGLPHFLTELGMNTFEFMLDFGSFRDIQRHRNGVCRMPLHTTKYGFNSWYLEQLPESVLNEAQILINDQIVRIENLPTTKEIKQYYISLGFNMPCRVTYGLPAAVYVVELRSGKPVHPTLRKIAHKMSRALTESFPNLKLNVDLEPDDWDVRRGLQDIIKKEDLNKY